MSDPHISVFPTNLGLYDEGEPCGDWLELPFDPGTVAGWLRDHCRHQAPRPDGGTYEELVVTDYEIPGEWARTGVADVLAACGHGEHVPLDEWNLLDVMLGGTDPDRFEAIGLAAEQCEPRDVVEFLNVVEDADFLPFCEYSQGDSRDTPEERFGMTLAEETGLMAELEEHGAESAFDYGVYGRDASLGYALGDTGYLDLAAELPDVTSYTADELFGMHGLARSGL